MQYCKKTRKQHIDMLRINTKAIIDKMPKITNKRSKKLQALLVIDTQCHSNHS